FTRTLREDLSRALGGARIIDYAWYPSAPVEVAVAVNVLAFEVDTTGTATLTAGWALRDPHSHQVGYEGQSAIVEPAGGTPGATKGGRRRSGAEPCACPAVARDRGRDRYQSAQPLDEPCPRPTRRDIASSGFKPRARPAGSRVPAGLPAPPATCPS